MESRASQAKIKTIVISDFMKNSDIKSNLKLKFQGSEAKIYEGKFLEKETILKERFIKNYRHPDLDKSLTAERIKAEVRALNKCFDIGIKCPAVYFVDLQTRCIILEKIPNSITVKELISQDVELINSLLPVARKIGAAIARMHMNDLIHGDLTTSNILIKKDDVHKIQTNLPYDLYFIDFGLSKRDVTLEDKAVDLYVLERAISSSHPYAEKFYDAIKKEYFSKVGLKNGVYDKFEEVRQRGRKRTMVG